MDVIPLKLMYITNHPEVAQIAQHAGVDRIFVDLETYGKTARQGGMDTVQSHHTLSDIRAMADKLTTAELLVRINPIHDRDEQYCSSKEEIDLAIANGASVLMLPYFKTAKEVEMFVSYVDGRAKTMPLVETPEAVENMDDILRVDGINELFIGLNDLSLGYGKQFMFELLTDGTVEHLAHTFRDRGIPFGFGGIAALGQGMLPAEKVILEHYRLGSTAAILSRSFCNTERIADLATISEIFENGLRDIRAYERQCTTGRFSFTENCREIQACVERICQSQHG